MASSYVNDLRLNEMATGDASGTWGTTTNTNLELIGEALGYGTEGITTNANTHTTTVADGATDPGRAMYIEYTGTLDSACTITIAPNTLNRMHFIENGTSGSQNIIIKQGSGATITIPPGDVKAVYLDGAGSGAAVVDAFASLNVVDLKVQDDLTVTDDATIGGTLGVTGVLTTTAATVFNGGFASNADSTMGTDKKIQFRDAAIHISSSADGQLDLVADTEIQIAATTIDINGAINASGEIIAASLDISGNVDVDGTTETDVLTINGSQLNYKAFGTSSIMIGDTTTGTIDAANYNTGLGVNVFEDLTTGDNNVAVGFDALKNNTTGNSNVAVGMNCLDANTTGAGNVGIGTSAMGSNTTAAEGTGVGDGCLAANTTGALNTAFGAQTLAANTTGTNNTAVGGYTLNDNTTGVENVAVGVGALDANTTASYNTASGVNALGGNTTGASNSAFGNQALLSNTTAANNTAVGQSALLANTTGTQNTAVGSLALDAATEADNNTAIGYASLTTATTGADNVAVGRAALNENTSGSSNTAIGKDALESNTTASNNTAVGKDALTANTTSSDNTGVGKDALLIQTTQLGNTAIGFEAMKAATTGLGRNVGVGYRANSGINTGAANTAVGWSAGGSTTGNGNTVMGYITNPGAAAAENRICIGYVVNGTADNRVHLGSNGGHIYNDYTSNATWTQTSDERKKKDIVDDTLGLDFINDLRTTKYKFKARSEFPKEWVTYDAESTNPVDDKVHHGLIAQEVKQALDNAGVDSFEGWDKLPDGTQQISREMFVIPLIKAMQELSTQVDELKSELIALKGE